MTTASSVVPRLLHATVARYDSLKETVLMSRLLQELTEMISGRISPAPLLRKVAVVAGSVAANALNHELRKPAAMADGLAVENVLRLRCANNALSHNHEWSPLLPATLAAVIGILVAVAGVLAVAAAAADEALAVAGDSP